MKTNPPRYALLQSAILHLKQSKGASLAQIRKHLEANYERKLNITNKKHLANALNGLVQTGKIAKKGVIYKLITRTARAHAGSEDDDDDVVRRRSSTRRGKPITPAGYCHRRRSHSRHHRRGRHHSRRRRRTHHRRGRHHRRKKVHHRRRHHRRRKTHHRRRRHHKRRRLHHRRRRSHFRHRSHNINGATNDNIPTNSHIDTPNRTSPAHTASKESK